ncbi:hypothetical protein PTKIN_Ptkin10aG0102400 [Pterospermum kingtungense]
MASKPHARPQLANSLHGLPDFCFETIPDGLPPSDADDVTQDTFSLFESLSTNGLDPFRGLLYKLKDHSVPASSIAPPFTCIISDDTISFPIEAVQEFGIPGVRLWTSSTCSWVCYGHFSSLVEQGPVRNASGIVNEYLDTVTEWIPGMEKIRFRDLPSYVRTTDPNDPMLNHVLKESLGDYKPSALILNKFDSLEEDALKTMSSALDSIPVYCIGPLHLLADQIKDDKLQHIDSNLWTEQPECLKWLDSKEPNSVVYVNFGSVAVMTPEQLIEFAWGLADSKHQFLWIIRPDLVRDQPTNSWFACTKWGIGMEINNNVKRDEVEMLVRELMEGEKGVEMKAKAME